MFHSQERTQTPPQTEGVRVGFDEASQEKGLVLHTDVEHVSPVEKLWDLCPFTGQEDDVAEWDKKYKGPSKRITEYTDALWRTAMSSSVHARSKA